MRRPAVWVAVLAALATSCRIEDCPKLPEGRATDAAFVTSVIRNVHWELESVNGQVYQSIAPGPSSLRFYESEPGVYVAPQQMFTGRTTCRGEGSRTFTVQSDVVVPRHTGEVGFLWCKARRSSVDGAIDELLDRPFRIALEGSRLRLSGSSGELVYRSEHAAPVAGGPLIGTWRIVAGPRELVRAHLRIRLANDRTFRARFDCNPPGWCRTDGTFGLGCDGTSLRFRVDAGAGPEAAWRELPVLNEVRLVSSSGDSLVFETNDDMLELRRVDRIGELEPDGANW